MAIRKNTKKANSKMAENKLNKSSVEKKPLKKFGGIYKSNRKKILIGAFVLIILGLLFYYKSLFVAAMVNNQPIGRLSVIKELEKRQGKDTLENLVTETLILQEAGKKNVTVGESDINDEIKKIEDNLKTQGTSLDTALSYQGMTKDDLIKQIKYQKIIEKLLSDKIEVTDKDVDDYVKENKTLFDKTLSQDQIKEQAKQQLKNQKLGQEFQKWIADLKANAKINYFVTY